MTDKEFLEGMRGLTREQARLVLQNGKECKQNMRISKNKLALAMLNAGIGSIKELAAVSGVSINTLSRSNNGGAVKLPTLARIAKALSVDPAEIMEME